MPDSVLFSGNKAYKNIWEKLLNENTLHAVMSLPAGIFQPYAGVKCSVLLFTQGGHMDMVQFLDIVNDGYKLDTNHIDPINEDDLPNATQYYHDWRACKTTYDNRDTNAEWTEKYWFATVNDILDNDSNLTISQYKPKYHKPVEYDDPTDILTDLSGIDKRISEHVQALKSVL